jgi:hypothetical protein
MDDRTALRIMAERLAARFAGFGLTGTADRPPPEVLPAAVPDDWPAGIPLPPGATIIGAIRQVALAPGATRRTYLLFDVPLGVGQVRAFYLNALVRAGWSFTERVADGRLRPQRPVDRLRGRHRGARRWDAPDPGGTAGP